MNGTSRLYRSTSERMLGGVAAGMANYLKIDANVIRLIWLVLALITGGGFAVLYLVLWLLLPTATSTATDVNGVIHENLNDMAAQFRGYTGIQINTGSQGTPGNQANMTANAQPGAAPTGNQAQLPQMTGRTRTGNGPLILIMAGLFFLLINLGFFHWIAWGIWWPILLIGLGAWLISRRA